MKACLLAYIISLFLYFLLAFWFGLPFLFAESSKFHSDSDFIIVIVTLKCKRPFISAKAKF